MPSFKSRGLRGSVLEELINNTNEAYRSNGLALVQKIPTPITPVEFEPNTRHIKLAYFEQKSTVDYIGVVQGIPICFDAKECHSNRFRLENIHEHQYNFMKDFQAQDGISFIILYFSTEDLFYYLSFNELNSYYQKKNIRGFGHIKMEKLDKARFFSFKNNLRVPYLDMLQFELDSRLKNKGE